jgi:hypothetical protein
MSHSLLYYNVSANLTIGYLQLFQNTGTPSRDTSLYTRVRPCSVVNTSLRLHVRKEDVLFVYFSLSLTFFSHIIFFLLYLLLFCKQSIHVTSQALIHPSIQPHHAPQEEENTLFPSSSSSSSQETTPRHPPPIPDPNPNRRRCSHPRTRRLATPLWGTGLAGQTGAGPAADAQPRRHLRVDDQPRDGKRSRRVPGAYG